MTLLTSVEEVAFSTLLAFIFFLGLFGNIAVCLAIYTDYNLRQQVPNALIFNLAVTDLLTVLFVVPFCTAAILQGEWIFGNFWCQTTAFLYYTLAIVAVESLAFISLDRFYAIVRPLKYRMIVTSQKVIFVIAFSWIWATIFTTPCIFMGWFAFGPFESLCTYSFVGTGDKWKTEVITYSVITIITCVLAPFALMIFSYVRIFAIVYHHSRRVAIPPNQDNHENIDVPIQRRQTTRWNINIGYKGYRTIVLIVVIFLFSWAPFSVARLAKTLTWNHEAVPAAGDTFATVFSFLSAATNPVAYGLFRKDFRRAFLKLFRQMAACFNCGRGGFRVAGEQSVHCNNPPISR